MFTLAQEFKVIGYGSVTADANDLAYINEKIITKTLTVHGTTHGETISPPVLSKKHILSIYIFSQCLNDPIIVLTLHACFLKNRLQISKTW